MVDGRPYTHDAQGRSNILKPGSKAGRAEWLGFDGI